MLYLRKKNINRTYFNGIFGKFAFFYVVYSAMAKSSWSPPWIGFDNCCIRVSLLVQHIKKK